MAKTLTITQESILRSAKITPGWYPAVIKDVTDVTASTFVDGWKVSFIIEGNGQFKGTPIETRYWENATGFANPLIAAIQGKKLKDIQPGSFDLSNAIGKRVQIYIQNGSYNNRSTNEITDFQPMPTA